MKLTSLGSNITNLYDGLYTMFATDSNGTLYGWGVNSNLLISTDSSLNTYSPVIIENLYNVQALEKIGNMALASDSGGEIYIWGNNLFGQIGDGTTENVGVPLAISSLAFTSLTQTDATTTEGNGNVNSVIPIVGTINALEISFTHPANISYAINPNEDDGFYCSDIQIQNNSKVPVKVAIEAFEACSGGDLVFQDVLPGSLDWNGLNKQETKTYIALGLQYADKNQWLHSVPEMIDPLYAIEINSTFIGSLARMSAASLRLNGSYGLAFDNSYTSMHEIIFVISLN